MLNIFSVSKSYAKSTFKAVDNLTLRVEKGVIYGFIGPNGAGKTTTIKMLTGILPFDEGNIEINGYDIKRDPINAKRSIGFVPDNHVIYEKLTGREYINFMADIYRVDLNDRKKRAEKYLELFNLTKDVDSQISSYSHGMKQKICVIGALIHNPPLWVLDEPLTGLDPQSSYELKNLMREHTRQGNTVFFSTHVLEVAEKLCDRIGIINKGKLVLEGTMDEIKALGGKDDSLEQIFLKITNHQNVQV
ncbi:MAG TPA: ABC transporter ATP-binding protein [Clostridia bacterium]